MARASVKNIERQVAALVQEVADELRAKSVRVSEELKVLEDVLEEQGAFRERHRIESVLGNLKVLDDALYRLGGATAPALGTEDDLFENRVVEYGQQLQRREYWRDVKDLAADIADEARTEQRDLDEVFDERVFESPWYTNYGRQLQTLQATDHQDALFEYESGELRVSYDGSASDAFGELARAAFFADVREELENVRAELFYDDLDEEEEEE